LKEIFPLSEEHTSQSRPSTREKHQKGQRRKKKNGEGGEKNDQRRPPTR
jgi:hypothetical protein